MSAQSIRADEKK